MYSASEFVKANAEPLRKESIKYACLESELYRKSGLLYRIQNDGKLPFWTRTFGWWRDLDPGVAHGGPIFNEW